MSLTRKGWTGPAIAVLALSTALIHWYLLIEFFDIPFLLNGLGYLALLVALFANVPFLRQRRRQVHYVFMGYTAISILAWLFVGARNPIGFIDKSIEVLLVVALWLHLRAANST